MKPVETVPFVEVEWDDAWGDATVAVFPQDAHEAHKPEGIKSYGWLLISDDKGVSLFSEKCDDGSYRGRSFILKAMIRSIIPLKLTKPRKAKRENLSHRQSAEPEDTGNR